MAKDTKLGGGRKSATSVPKKSAVSEQKKKQEPELSVDSEDDGPLPASKENPTI